MPFNDITGQRFGRLTVTSRTENYIMPSGGQKAQWVCKCDCGNTKVVTTTHLKSGHTSSCGCLQLETLENGRHANRTHGMKGSPEYRSWQAMKQRCLNQNNVKFRLYGERGITICEQWLDSFETFFADMGTRPDGTTLDRIDGSKGYYPGNCRWATYSEQNRNRRKYHHSLCK